MDSERVFRIQRPAEPPRAGGTPSTAGGCAPISDVSSSFPPRELSLRLRSSASRPSTRSPGRVHTHCVPTRFWVKVPDLGSRHPTSGETKTCFRRITQVTGKALSKSSEEEVRARFPDSIQKTPLGQGDGGSF